MADSSPNSSANLRPWPAQRSLSCLSAPRAGQVRPGEAARSARPEAPPMQFNHLYWLLIAASQRAAQCSSLARETGSRQASSAAISRDLATELATGRPTDRPSGGLGAKRQVQRRTIDRPAGPPRDRPGRPQWTHNASSRSSLATWPPSPLDDWPARPAGLMRLAQFSARRPKGNLSLYFQKALMCNLLRLTACMNGGRRRIGSLGAAT